MKERESERKKTNKKQIFFLFFTIPQKQKPREYERESI